jgi:hypothetical protein
MTLNSMSRADFAMQYSDLKFKPNFLPFFLTKNLTFDLGGSPHKRSIEYSTSELKHKPHKCCPLKNRYESKVFVYRYAIENISLAKN